LEAGLGAAYLARYRPDVSARLSEAQLHHVESRLREFLDLEDRRITILAAIRQQERMTPELQKSIEECTDRHLLEDFYIPYKPKRRSAADDAEEKGLQPLARQIWEQPAGSDPETLAAQHVNPEGAVSSIEGALEGARQIIARWLAEDAEIRGALRPLMHQESEFAVGAGAKPIADEGPQRKTKSLVGMRAKTADIPWRQLMTVRRAVRDGLLRCEIVLPEERAVQYMVRRLVQASPSPYEQQITAAARDGFRQYLAQQFAAEVSAALDERCDIEAVQSFQKNLRRMLLAPPAGPLAVIGLETGRRGGWRAAVVGPDGSFLEGAIVHEPEGAPQHDTESATSREGGSPRPTDEHEADRAAGEFLPSEEAERPEGTAAADAALTEAQEDHSAGAETGAESQDTREAAGVPAAAPPAEPAVQAAAAAADAAIAAPANETETAPQQAAALTTASDVSAFPAHQETSSEAGGSGTEGRAESRSESPRAALSELITRHNVAAIVFSNAPGARQVERFIRAEVRQAGAPGAFWTTIHDAGTWIYATSKTARSEFPKLDPVMRSAITLARRLQDPLAELVKTDAKVLGGGQFHHDVDARRLRAGLRQVLEEVVHLTGADLNSASLEQLALIPGITERVAKRIVEHRKSKGRFTRREQLLQVAGLNERIYEQAAGFLRVRGGENPLDDTGIHPLHYPVAERILAAAGVSAAEACEKPQSLEAVQLDSLQSPEHRPELLKAVLREFKPSVRNPRGAFSRPESTIPLRPASELKVGMKIEGVVTNIAKFGAFVDIGADQDGLVHVSQLSDKFVEDPQSAVKVGDRVSVHILALEQEGKRISLTMKEPRAPRETPERRVPRPGERRAQAAVVGQRDNGARRRRRTPEQERDRDPAMGRRTFGPDEKAKALEEKEAQKLSIDEKLALLKSKYRTKI
jgi:transcriptional accessory protein Tex/SPT6